MSNKQFNRRKSTNHSKPGVKMSKRIAKITNKTTDQCNDLFSRFLRQKVPDDITVDFPNQVDHTKDIINESNAQEREAVITTYIINETERVKRQRPLLFAVLVITFIQLLVFNAIVAAVVYLSFISDQQETINNLFEILKYYIGATVAELIGMVLFIVTGTFSSSHVETMKILLRRNKD